MTLQPGGQASDQANADWSLIEQFVTANQNWQKWQRWQPDDAETLFDLGDMETHWVLARRNGRFTFETISRGHRRVTAEFTTERDARRFLLMRLGSPYRSSRGWPDLGLGGPAPGTTLEQAPSGYQLAWPGGTASFPSRNDALEFSWVAAAEPAEIAASYRDRNGRPLFDLGLPEPESPTRPASPTSTLRPWPAETPPPDDPGADLPVIEQATADLGWTTRHDAAGPDVLLVDDGSGAGRVISYQLSRFAYQSFVSDWRKTVATFSTAAAARRFLIMDLGAILRTRRRLGIIRAFQPHPATRISKGPTEFEVTWPGGTATFGLGYVGQQRALTFTWCATAAAADIATSYRDPIGAPLFDVHPEHETRPPWHP